MSVYLFEVATYIIRLKGNGTGFFAKGVLEKGTSVSFFLKKTFEKLFTLIGVLALWSEASFC